MGRMLSVSIAALWVFALIPKPVEGQATTGVIPQTSKPSSPSRQPLNRHDSRAPAASPQSTTAKSSGAAASPLDGPPLQDIPTWSQVGRAILLTAIPPEYVDRKNWDKTIEVFDGFNVQQRGLNIRMSERRRKVNHGSWYMFTVRFPKPEQNVAFVIDQVQPHDFGDFTCAVHVAMRKIWLYGQFEQWVLGVKGVNFDIESEVEVHLHAVVRLTVRTEMKKGSFFPDLRLDPVIKSVRLNLVDVNTRRVGRIGGDLAEELGNSSRRFFEDLIHSQESRVLKKANEAIQKKKDSLKLTTSKVW